MAGTLQPQAALEQAALNAVQANPLGGITWTGQNSARMYDGQPAPKAGNWFLSVWYDGQRGSDGQRVRLGELFGVYLTITRRFTQPFDRWVQHRDEVEAVANAAKALICQDGWNYSIINAANTLAGFRSAGQSGGPPVPVGWCEGLVFQGFDPLQDVGPGWFHAKVDGNPELAVGCAQRVKFGMARRAQFIPTAS